MNILMLNAPNVPYTDVDLLMPQIDLLQEAGLLEDHGHQVAMYDMDAKRHTISNLEAKLDAEPYDLVFMLFDEMIPLHSHAAYEQALAIGQMITKRGIKVALGGMVPSYFYKETLDREFHDEVAVLVGPVGPALMELLSDGTFSTKGKLRIAYKKEDGTIVGPDRESIELLEGYDAAASYGVPARRLLDEVDYPIDVRAITATRGCMPKGKGCRFCPYPSFWGRQRPLSVDKTLADIEQLIESGFEKILFLDNAFTFNPNHILEVARGIIANGYNKHIMLGGLSRVDMNFRIMDTLQEAGLVWVHFGVESGDEETLIKLRKKTQIDRIRWAFAEARSRGLRTRASIIIDGGDTKESVDRTVDLMYDVAPNEVKPHFLAPRIYTDMQDHAPRIEKQSIFGDETAIFKTDGFADYTVRRLQEMSDAFERSGYDIMLKANPPEGFWQNLWQRGEAGLDCNFVSVAPARYGIGWGKRNGPAAHPKIDVAYQAPPAMGAMAQPMVAGVA